MKRSELKQLIREVVEEMAKDSSHLPPFIFADMKTKRWEDIGLDWQIGHDKISKGVNGGIYMRMHPNYNTDK